MSTVGSNSDVSNDVLFRQEDKDFHQVKSCPPTQQLVIKLIVLNFGLHMKVVCLCLTEYIQNIESFGHLELEI